MNLSLPAWLSRLESLHPKAIDLGLERCREVYRRLGEPRPARQVWTIGGTNGKGSVAAYLSGMLLALGKTCGRFTSPHILNFNERICVNGVEVNDETIVASLERVERAREDVSLTYFEFTTLAALSLFHEARLDTAVLEVGLGGRLDAVNVVDTDCAVITSIGLDHEDYLGSGRESIGREKAGIMRPGRPVVIGDSNPPDSVLAYADGIGASPLRRGVDFTLVCEAANCRFRQDVTDVLIAAPPLPGRHQLDNLATALAALKALVPDALEARIALDSGIRSVRMPGRLERPQEDVRVLLDVGHNPLAAQAVARFLKSADHGQYACVLAMLADKDAEAVVRELSPVVSQWYCGGLSGPRGQSGAELASRLARAGAVGPIRSFETVAEALGCARAEAAQCGQVLVFGSFETVAAAKRALAA